MPNATQQFVLLGRFMIQHAPRFADDALCNDWARVGNLLTGLGMPFAPKLREFEAKDQQVVRDAAAVMVGKVAMPELMVVVPPAEPKRTRKARMTRVMTKPEKKVTVPKLATGEAPKRRGRPPGSKNKPKAAAAKVSKSKRK